MADTGRTVFADGLWSEDFWAAGLWAADAAVIVPDVDDPGTTQAAAELAITGLGLVAAVVTAYSSTVPAGEVISQSPAAGSSVAPGSTVTITVSLGEAPVTDTQPSGGYWWPHWQDQQESRRRRKKREEELEAEAEELAREIADKATAEIAQLLRKQEAEDERRAELARLQKLVDRFQASKPFSDAANAALDRAFEARTALALELFNRAMENMVEEEEMAMLLALLADD